MQIRNDQIVQSFVLTEYINKFLPKQIHKMIEENQTLDGTLNYKGDSRKITWMKAKYLVIFKFGHSYKNTLWVKRGGG